MSSAHNTSAQPAVEPAAEGDGMTQQDLQHLIKLNGKFQMIRDAVGAVVLGLETGYILLGRGGIGKTRVVIKELEERGVRFVHTNSHLTPAGLFARLDKYPKDIHLLEDVEEVLRDKVSVSVLRSALWSSERDPNRWRQRVITWITHEQSRKCVFHGGLIIVSNGRLADSPDLSALQTRVRNYELIVSSQELAAFMRYVAGRGGRIGQYELDADKCLEVADFIIEQATIQNRELDMRMLHHGISARIQVEIGETYGSWKDNVAAIIAGAPVRTEGIRHSGLRGRQRDGRLAVARQVHALPSHERLPRWQELTGMSRATLYRSMANVGHLDNSRLADPN